MRVCDFMDLCIDDGTQIVEIFDANKCETVFHDCYGNIPEEYTELEIQTWNTGEENDGWGLGRICFNVEIEN